MPNTTMNKEQRKEFLEKHQSTIQKLLGRKLSSKEIQNMVNFEVPEDLLAEIPVLYQWGQKQQKYYEDHYKNTDLMKGVLGGDRFLYYFLDISGTPEGEEENRKFIESLKTPEGIRAFGNRVCSELLTTDPDVFLGVRDTSDAVKDLKIYEKNMLKIQTGYVIKVDFLNDAGLSKYVPEEIRNVILDRKLLFEQASANELFLGAMQKKYAWLFMNLPLKDLLKLESSENYQSVDLLGITNDSEEEELIANDFEKAKDFALSLPDPKKGTYISHKEAAKWKAEGKLSPYMKAIKDGKTIDVYTAMLEMKAGKKVSFVLRPDAEMEALHNLMQGKESAEDQKIYAQYAAKKKKSADAQKKKSAAAQKKSAAAQKKKSAAAKKADDSRPAPKAPAEELQNLYEKISVLVADTCPAFTDLNGKMDQSAIRSSDSEFEALHQAAAGIVKTAQRLSSPFFRSKEQIASVLKEYYSCFKTAELIVNSYQETVSSLTHPDIIDTSSTRAEKDQYALQMQMKIPAALQDIAKVMKEAGAALPADEDLIRNVDAVMEKVQAASQASAEQNVPHVQNRIPAAHPENEKGTEEKETVLSFEDAVKKVEVLQEDVPVSKKAPENTGAVGEKVQKEQETFLDTDPVTGAYLQQRVPAASHPEMSEREKVFLTARKDMISLATHMDLLLSRSSSKSREFKRLVEAVEHAAGEYPEDSADLQIRMEGLREAARDYMKAKDEDLYSKVSSFFGRTVGENRFGDDGQQRYQFAQLAYSLCQDHIRMFQKTYRDGPASYNSYVPDTGSIGKMHVDADLHRDLGDRLRGRTFDPDGFSRYYILNELKQNALTSSLRHLRNQDLEDRSRLMSSSPDMKMTVKVIGERKLSMHEMVGVYKAVRKYAEDRKTVSGLQPEQIQTIRDSISSGKDRYLHTAGNSEIDTELKNTVLQQYAQISEETMNRRMDAFAKACRQKNTSVALLYRAFPGKSADEIALAAALMIRQDRGDSPEDLIDRILNPAVSAEKQKVLQEAERMLKDKDPDIAGLYGEVLPKLQEITSAIADRNNLKEMKFAAEDRRRLQVLCSIEIGFSNLAAKKTDINEAERDFAMNHPRLPENYLDAVRSYHAVLHKFINPDATGAELAKVCHNGVDTKELVKIVGASAGRKLFLKKYGNELERILKSDLKSMEKDAVRDTNSNRITDANKALDKFMNGAAMIDDIEALEHWKHCPQGKRMTDVLGGIKDPKQIEIIAPFLEDGSLGEQMNIQIQPELLKENQPDTLRNIDLIEPVHGSTWNSGFKTADEIIGWAREEKNRIFTEYQKQYQETEKKYQDFRRKHPDSLFNKDLEKGLESMAHMYSKGLIPPCGLMNPVGERADQASLLMKNVLESGFLLKCAEKGMSYENAQKNYKQMLQQEEVQNVLKHPDLKTVRRFVLNDGCSGMIERSLRQNQPAVPQHAPVM